MKKQTSVGVGGVFLMLGVIFLLTLDSKIIGLPFLLAGVALLMAPAWQRRASRRPGRDRSDLDA